jgi:ribosomal protein S18 acetylase RimI-like enzyme
MTTQAKTMTNPNTAKTAKTDMSTTTDAAAPTVRALSPDDLDAVITIDAANAGRARRGFFVTRLAAVKRDPTSFLALGIEDGGALAGFVIARIFRGEFGTDEPVASIDAIGVSVAKQGRGLGSALMAGFEDAMLKRGIVEVMSQDLWSGAPLMRFFAANGFELAPRWVLERPLDDAIDF